MAHSLARAPPAPRLARTRQAASARAAWPGSSCSPLHPGRAGGPALVTHSKSQPEALAVSGYSLGAPAPGPPGPATRTVGLGLGRPRAPFSEAGPARPGVGPGLVDRDSESNTQARWLPVPRPLRRRTVTCGPASGQSDPSWRDSPGACRPGSLSRPGPYWQPARGFAAGALTRSRTHPVADSTPSRTRWR